MKKYREISNIDQGDYKKDQTIRIVMENRTYNTLNLDTRLEPVVYPYINSFGYTRPIIDEKIKKACEDLHDFARENGIFIPERQKV